VLVTSTSGHGLLIAILKKATSTSETSVNFYQAIQRNNPKHNHLYRRRHESLKSDNDKQMHNMEVATAAVYPAADSLIYS
jgi:hypothetical protein